MNELSESAKRRVGDQGFDLSAAEITPEQVRAGRLKRRREKIVAEIERNRRGDYTVPTWALTALLVAFIVGFAALIILVGN